MLDRDMVHDLVRKAMQMANPLLATRHVLIDDLSCPYQ